MPEQNPSSEDSSRVAGGETSGAGAEGPSASGRSPEPDPPGPSPDRQSLGPASPPAALQGLVKVQNRMIQRYFQLQLAEQRLSQEVGRRPPDAGRRSILQMEMERQRLGRDLHTGVGQMLAATRLQLEIIEAQWPTAPPPVQQALHRIAELTSQALDQVRAVSRRLHPPEWQRLSLPDALRQLWDLSGVPERTAARFTIAAALPEPDLEIRILLYRALQEALANVARHSRATAVTATLERSGGRLILTVRDNGVGFDAPALWASPPNLKAGIGLRAIREQAAAIGGELRVHSGPDGTTLEVSVPETESPTP